MTDRILLAALAALGLSACTPRSEAPEPAEAPTITARPLPASITYPEGVAWDAEAGAYYVASAANGAITRITLADNASTSLVPAGGLGEGRPEDFPMALGLRLDEADRLWVAGGARGDLRIVDTASGQVIKHLTRPAGPASLLNDLAFTADAAYVTDSTRPVLWRVSRAGGQIGELEPWLDLADLIPHPEGPNLNGIVATPDGASLIAVQMNTGLLWKIDIAGRSAARIDLGGALLRGGDGLVLDGRRLYVTVQDTHEVVAIDLAPDLTAGSVIGHVRDDRFVAPATAFLENDTLHVVASQMSAFQDDTAVRPFAVYEVPVAALERTR